MRLCEFGDCVSENEASESDRNFFSAMSPLKLLNNFVFHSELFDSPKYPRLAEKSGICCFITEIFMKVYVIKYL